MANNDSGVFGTRKMMDSIYKGGRAAVKAAKTRNPFTPKGNAMAKATLTRGKKGGGVTAYMKKRMGF